MFCSTGFDQTGSGKESSQRYDAVSGVICALAFLLPAWWEGRGGFSWLPNPWEGSSQGPAGTWSWHMAQCVICGRHCPLPSHRLLLRSLWGMVVELWASFALGALYLFRVQIYSRRPKSCSVLRVT